MGRGIFLYWVDDYCYSLTITDLFLQITIHLTLYHQTSLLSKIICINEVFLEKRLPKRKKGNIIIGKTDIKITPKGKIHMTVDLSPVFCGKKVILLGAGVSNMPLARMLSKMGAEIEVRDKKMRERGGSA